MAKDKLNAITKQLLAILGEVGFIKNNYSGHHSLINRLLMIEDCANKVLDYLEEKEGKQMNPLAVFKAMQIIQGVFKKLPDETKKKIDAEIDKIEDRFKQGSLPDKLTEDAMKIVRLQISVPDYPDVIDENPES